MKPGREFDLLIAIRVMGLTEACLVCHRCDTPLADSDGYFKTVRCSKCDWKLVTVPPYSTDIEEAWKVVEKLVNDNWEFDFGSAMQGNERGWNAWFDFRTYRAWSKSAPEAICRAALDLVISTEEAETCPDCRTVDGRPGTDLSREICLNRWHVSRVHKGE